MKKVLVLLVIAVLMVGTVYAGGDKNRGSKGQGNVHQVVGP